MYRIMETGCAKWIMIKDGEVKFTSNTDEATIFEKPLKEVLNEYERIAKYKNTLYTSDSF